MDRATKLLLVLWACAVVAAEAYLLGKGWPRVQYFAVGTFLAAAIAAAIDRRTVSIVLLFTYLFPIVVWQVRGHFVAQFAIVWLAPLVGAMLPLAIRTRWHVPASWRLALAGWGLAIAAGSVIVAAREMDFHPAVLDIPRGIGNSVIGGTPSGLVEWVLHVSLTLVAGILWFDWLVQQSESDRFRYVIVPLGISWLLMCCVAIYQMFVDVLFWNPTPYGVMGRAAGTVLDGNVCGTIAALGMGMAAFYSRSFERGRLALIGAGALIGWLTVWGTGSRTALAAASIVSVFTAIDLYLYGGTTARLTRGRLIVGTAALIALLAAFAASDLRVTGPIERVQAMFPGGSLATWRWVASELWNRNGFGARAMDMIAEYPLFGVGVGAFHILMPDYAALYGGPKVVDNAQNWFRHQFAEFGLIGSAGWLVWSAGFAWFVFGHHSTRPRVFGLWTGRGLLLAFGVISLVGMPAQNPLAAITFWTIAAAFVCRVGAPSAAAASRAGWIAITVLVLVYAAGTTFQAVNELRVPMRAKRVGWPYSYGLYPPEHDAAGREFRWTARRAAAVVDVQGAVLRLAVSANHADIQQRPVAAKVWCDGELVLERELNTTAEQVVMIPMEDGEKRVVIDTSAGRVVRPSDNGLPDTRELGLMIRWEFINSPG
jgi:hypothetical protein